MKEVIIFIIAFLLPFAYYRTVFLIAREKVFEKPLKTKSGFQIHHLHYGVVAILAASIVLLFSDKNLLSIILLGGGLGLIFDEFISSLRIPEDRPQGLKLYGESLKETLVLFVLISFFLLVSALIYSPK